MPRVQRQATASWTGNVARGEGSIAPASGTFEPVPYTLASRIGKPDGKTSPEELLASAHAGCYAMSLAGELAGVPDQRRDRQHRKHPSTRGRARQAATTSAHATVSHGMTLICICGSCGWE